MKLEFPWQFFKHNQILNFMKICPAGAELFHADGGADRQAYSTKVIVDLRDFGKRT
jgi:hypothetical protein